MAPQTYQPNSTPVHQPFGPIAVSIKDAARLVGLDETTIRDHVNKRNIPAKRSGRKILVSVEGLRAWFDGLDDASDAS